MHVGEYGVHRCSTAGGCNEEPVKQVGTLTQTQISLPEQYSLSECISEPEVKGSASEEHELSRPAGACCVLHAEP